MRIRLGRQSRLTAHFPTELGISSSPQSSAALRCRESYEANAWHPASDAAATCHSSRLRVPKVAENLAESCSARMKTAANGIRCARFTFCPSGKALTGCATGKRPKPVAQANLPNKPLIVEDPISRRPGSHDRDRKGTLGRRGVS